MKLRALSFVLSFALALAGLGGAAHAQAPAGAPAISPPAGWLRRAPLTTAVRSEVTLLQVYYPPGSAEAGPYAAALYVTRVERKAAADRRDAVASAELDELTAAQRRQGPGAKTVASTRRADPAARRVEAELSWQDAGLGVADASRVVAAADAERVVAITGQCLTQSDAPAALVAACTGALATLDPGIPATARVPLAIVEGAEPAPAITAAPLPVPAASAGAPAAGGAATMGPPPARLDGGPRVAIPQPSLPAQRREADRRPIYVGLGLIAIAALFWWNRRRRERFEAEDTGAGAPAGGDADELHAAADEPESEPKQEPKPKAPKAARDRKEKDA